MVLLKTTTLLIGLMAPSSMSIDHTLVPTMLECKTYLTTEEKRQRETSHDIEILRSDVKLAVKLNFASHSAQFSFECVDVK